MITGKSKSGFTYEIEEECLDDWGILKTAQKVDKGQVGYIVDLGEALIGAEQMDRLEKHVAERNGGKVRATDMVAEIFEIMNAAKSTKNS